MEEDTYFSIPKLYEGEDDNGDSEETDGVAGSDINITTKVKKLGPDVEQQGDCKPSNGSDIGQYSQKVVESAFEHAENVEKQAKSKMSDTESSDLLTNECREEKRYDSDGNVNTTTDSEEGEDGNMEDSIQREATQVTNSDDITVKTCIRCKAMFTSLTDVGVTLSTDDPFTCRSCTENSSDDCENGDFSVDLVYGDRTNNVSLGEKQNKNVQIKISGLGKCSEGDLVLEISCGERKEKVHVAHDDLSSGEMMIKFKTEKKIIRPFIPEDVQQFPCSDCGDSFRDTRTLADHKLTHPCIKPWVCLECGKEFKYKNLVLRHKLTHTNIKDYICDVCKKAFRTKANLKRHRLSAHKDSAAENKSADSKSEPLAPLEIQELSDTTRIKKRKIDIDYREDSGSGGEESEVANFNDDDADYDYELDEKSRGSNENMRAPPSKVRYKCKMCDKEFTNKGKWKRHELYHFQMRMPICEICERSFVDKDYLMEHLRTHEDKFADYVCKICQSEFPFTDELDHHMLEHANSEEKTNMQPAVTQNGNGTYKCTECDKSFRSNYILQRHLVTHNRATCQCQECGKFYSCRYNLTQHMMIHNTNSQYICDQCGESFKVKQYLSRHMIKHREQKTWACNLCDLKFYRQGNLRHHMKQHVEEKPFQCTHCEKAFVREKTLEEHILLTHTKEKPYQCPICGRGFGLRRMIKPHMKIHSGQKEHKCEECGKLFTYKSNLNQHMMVHSGQKPFICQYCGKGFARNKYLNDHMRTHTVTTVVPDLPDISNNISVGVKLL